MFAWQTGPINQSKQIIAVAGGRAGQHLRNPYTPSIVLTTGYMLQQPQHAVTLQAQADTFIQRIDMVSPCKYLFKTLITWSRTIWIVGPLNLELFWWYSLLCRQILILKNWDLEHFKNIFHLQNESSSEHLNVSSTLSNDAHYTGIFIYTPTLSQQQHYISIL